MTQEDLHEAILDQQRIRGHQAARYPKDLRESVAEYSRSECSQGSTLGSVAESLGLSVNTLRRWSVPRASSRRLKSVKMVPSPERSCPVLVTPSGHRVEGLSMASLLDLLGRLG